MNGAANGQILWYVAYISIKMFKKMKWAEWINVTCAIHKNVMEGDLSVSRGKNSSSINFIQSLFFFHFNEHLSCIRHCRILWGWKTNGIQSLISWTCHLWFLCHSFLHFISKWTGCCASPTCMSLTAGGGTNN